MTSSSPDETLTPDYKASIEFLRKVARVVHLVAINPNQRGQITGKVFLADGPQRFDDMRAFIEEWNARKHWNVYFTTGTVRRDLDCDKNPKARDTDIQVVTMFKVDLDPSKNIPKDWSRSPEEFVEQQRARILASLTTDLPTGVVGPPTIVLDSGGGGWGLWLFGLQYDIEKDSERPLMVARNEHLIELYRAHFRDGGVVADGVADLSRICRLVGTVNWPDKKKAAAGRTPRLASMDEGASNLERRYGPNQFDPPEGTSAARRSNGVAVTIDAANVPRVQNLDAELPSTVPPVVKRIIACGEDEMNTEPIRAKWSRSEWQWWATCEMARQGVKPEVIYSILTDPGWTISNAISVDSNGLPRTAAAAERYVQRQVRRALEFAVAPELMELNDEYAFVEEVGGRARIMSFYRDPVLDQDEVVFQLPGGFKLSKNNRNVVVGKGKDDKLITAPLGDWWVRHPRRRTYDRVVFAPGLVLPPSAYNLWQGFGVDPAPGDCGLYLAHLRENVCQGDEGHYSYLIRWMANAVQFPGRQGHVAVVLRGPKGVGKSFAATQFGKLWGRHFKHITNPDHLVGKFNAMLMDGALVFADEAFYAGDKRHEQALKTLITEDRITLELKGLDMKNWPNCMKLMMASNSEWIVPATDDERRYFVLDVGSERQQRRAYFTEIVEQMEAGGYAALLHMLLAMDLTGFDVTAVPKTDALREQVRLTTMTDYRASWMLTLLQDGCLPNLVEGEARGAFSTETTPGWKDGLYDHARSTVPELRNKSDQYLSHGPSKIGAVNVKPKGSGRFWRFPPLAEARRAWCEQYGPMDWPGDAGDDWAGADRDLGAKKALGDGK